MEKIITTILFILALFMSLVLMGYAKDYVGQATMSTEKFSCNNSGQIRITSIPSKARIYLDGEDTGNFTTARLKDIPFCNDDGSRKHGIRVVKEGYKDATKSFFFDNTGWKWIPIIRMEKVR